MKPKCIRCEKNDFISSHRPIVSIVIPTHNRSNLVTRAVHSALNQSFKDLEVIVVDDASKDNTPALIKIIADGDHRVHYIRNENPCGGGGARNIGIQNARGRYVAFLDDDDEWLPRKLERQIPYADHYSVVGCLTIKDNKIERLGLNINKERLTCRLLNEINITKITLNDVFYNNGRLSPTVALTKRNYLVEINGFDESLSGAQGRDIFTRLIKAYGEGIMLEAILTIHHQNHGQHRITESPYHLKGYWQEFKKHSQYMPWHLQRWRKYRLCLLESKKSYGIDRITWLIQAVLNINPYWPLRSAKCFFTTFFVK